MNTKDVTVTLPVRLYSEFENDNVPSDRLSMIVPISLGLLREWDRALGDLDALGMASLQRAYRRRFSEIDAEPGDICVLSVRARTCEGLNLSNGDESVAFHFEAVVRRPSTARLATEAKSAIALVIPWVSNMEEFQRAINEAIPAK